MKNIPLAIISVTITALALAMYSATLSILIVTLMQDPTTVSVKTEPMKIERLFQNQLKRYWDAHATTDNGPRNIADITRDSR